MLCLKICFSFWTKIIEYWSSLCFGDFSNKIWVCKNLFFDNRTLISVNFAENYFMFDSWRHFDMNDFFQSRKTKWEDCEDEPSRKEQRTSNQLLLFCDLILKYEKYKPHKEDMHDSAYSPSSSERSADSYSSESNSSFSSNRMSGEDGKGPSTDTDDDSWDLITCHCMKPFAGRPMIECTMCETWIHMSCAKIRRNNIPDDFICQLCREAKGSKRRSERIRSDDRRLLA